MKPQLNLRVQKFLDGETLNDGAIVQVRSLNEAGNTGSMQRLSVPVGADESRHLSLSVDPGVYEVSAILPSGETLTRVLDVMEGDVAIDASLDAGRSPHEWLSWQQWSGNIDPPRFSPFVETLDEPSTLLEEISCDPGAAVSLFSVPSFSKKSREKIWNALSKRLSNLDTGATIDPMALLPASAKEAEITEKLDGSDVVVHLPFGSKTGSNRAYLIVTMHKKSVLCVMPWPWLQSLDRKEVLVEALITGVPDALDGSSWSVRTMVRDEMFAGLLGYFAAGEQGIARELIGPAKELLYYKMNNPLAAVAGAYILIGQWIDDSAKGGMEHDWMEWVRKLNEYHPWLPDGAVLEGWLALRLRGREPQFEQARAALLEAERRGIPVYTAGVRRLTDGLMLVAAEALRRGVKDPEAEAALGRVRRLAWQIDPGQPFTCIRLWNS